MKISDEAVEAAMKALLRMDDGAWAVVDATYIDNLEPQVRRSLEAAAPFIAPEAPHPSPKVKGNTPQGQIRELLKHLDSWESQEHKTVTIAYLRRHFKDAA